MTYHIFPAPPETPLPPSLHRALLALALALSAAPDPARAEVPTLELLATGAPLPAETFGAFDLGVHVAPREGRKGSIHTWRPLEARVGDGLVGARLAADGPLACSLLVRVLAPDPTRGEPAWALTGLAVTFGAGEAWLERWDLGRRTPLTARVRLPESHAAIDLTARLDGERVEVELHPGVTLAARDSSIFEGNLAFSASGKTASSQRLERLSLTPTGAPRGGQLPPRLLDPPRGQLRLLALPPAALAALPADLEHKLLTREDPVLAQAVLETDPAGHDRLFALGLAPTFLGSDRPFRLVDTRSLLAPVAPVATPTGFRLDLGYKDAPRVEALLRAYHERFPALTRLVELGRSHAGRPILALMVSDHAERDEDEPAVLLNGGHHGNELLPVDNVLDALQTLLERPDAATRRLVAELEIWLVPLVNPDGNHAFWHLSELAGRKNGRDTDGNGRLDPGDGVDLNRNYPFRWGALGERASRSFHRHEYYRGEGPASEPETRAMLALAERVRPVASISYHTVSNVILVPYTTDGVDNPVGDEAWPIARAVAKTLPRQPTGKRMGVAKQIYAVDGVDQDHLRWAFGTVALLVEGALHNPLDPKRRQATIDATRGTWRALLKRVLDGPTLGGHVRDPEGRPLEAEVTLDELTPRAGERWTSRPRDGRFDRMVPTRGRYTLRVSAPGFAPYRATIQVRGRVEHEVTLTPLPAPR